MARKVKNYHSNMNKSKQMVAAMKLREAQALAEMPIDDTIPDSDDEEEDNDEEEGSEEEQHNQKFRRYASQGPPQKQNRVYGGGQPIVPPSPHDQVGKKKGISKIIGGIKKLF